MFWDNQRPRIFPSCHGRPLQHGGLCPPLCSLKFTTAPSVTSPTSYRHVHQRNIPSTQPFIRVKDSFLKKGSQDCLLIHQNYHKLLPQPSIDKEKLPCWLRTTNTGILRLAIVGWGESVPFPGHITILKMDIIFF